MTNVQVVKCVCAAALIAGFFMPWVTILGLSVPGYKIPEFAGGLQQLTKALGGKEDPRIFLFYLPYVVPTLALLLILNTINGESVESIAGILALITGALPFIGFVYLLNEVGKNLFDILAVGSYWTLTTAGGLLLTLFQPTPTKRPAARQETRRLQRTKSSTKASLSKNFDIGSGEFIYRCLGCGSFQASDAPACLNCGGENPHHAGAQATVDSAVSEPVQTHKRFQKRETTTSGKYFCSKCGERLEVDDKFCAYCGTQVS